MIQTTSQKIVDNIQKVIVGKEEVIQLLLAAVLCEGHILLEDVPGTGKTTLARALAASLGCSFRRIQFTPDLLPSDVTGLSWFNQKTQEFEFRPGPIMSQVVLGDEINRATPRTQAAMLEAMQERQVTGDGVTRLLERPFLVLATQNPVELEGTFPLPEAQLDRFLMRIYIGYPNQDEENAILERFRASDPLPDLQPVTSPAEVIAMQTARREIKVEDTVRDYIVRIARATRKNQDIQLGASPRDDGRVPGGSGLGRHPRPRLYSARRRQIPGALRAVSPPDHLTSGAAARPLLHRTGQRHRLHRVRPCGILT